MNIRQQIINELVDRMEDIDSVKSVYSWRVTELAPAESPIIIIKDTADNMPIDGVIGRIDHELNIDIEALFFGKESMDEAREMIASIAAAIGTDSTFNGLAYDTIMVSAEITAEETGKLNSTATLSIIINYRSDAWTL
jgi:hypothetical protein